MRRICYYVILILLISVFTSLAVHLFELPFTSDNFFRGILGTSFYHLTFFAPFSLFAYFYSILLFYFNELKKMKSIFSSLYAFFISLFSVCCLGLFISIITKNEISYGLPISSYVINFACSTFIFTLLMIPIHSYCRKRFNFLHEAK